MYFIRDGNFGETYVEEVARRYAIAMCEDQKVECLKNASTYLDANDTPIVADGSILNSKNVAE